MANVAQSPGQVTAHALQIGDRINTAGFEGQVLANAPLALLDLGPLVFVSFPLLLTLLATADQPQEFLRIHLVAASAHGALLGHRPEIGGRRFHSTNAALDEWLGADLIPSIANQPSRFRCGEFHRMAWHGLEEDQ